MVNLAAWSHTHAKLAMQFVFSKTICEQGCQDKYDGQDISLASILPDKTWRWQRHWQHPCWMVLPATNLQWLLWWRYRGSSAYAVLRLWKNNPVSRQLRKQSSDLVLNGEYQNKPCYLEIMLLENCVSGQLSVIDLYEFTIFADYCAFSIGKLPYFWWCLFANTPLYFMKLRYLLITYCAFSIEKLPSF